MSLSEEDIQTFVKENKGGSVEALYGPSSVGDEKIWEVWAFKYDEYAIRFVVESCNHNPEYFETFQALTVHFAQIQKHNSKKLISKINELKDKIKDRSLNRFRASNSLILTVIGGVIASGGAYFYGRWITINKFSDNQRRDS